MKKTGTLEAPQGQADSFETVEAFHALLKQVARSAIFAVIEAEVQVLCGPKHEVGSQSACYRAGSTPSSIYINTAREDALRPRVRRITPTGSEEVTLKSWQHARNSEAWGASVMRAILCGVSTRKVALLRESELKGESHSNISRLWQRKAAELVEEMQQSDLADFEMLVLMVDAVVLSKGLVATVALGIDTHGNKRILGFRVGSSENETVCTDLLSSLNFRGLKVSQTRYLLAVLDGSKALKKAVTRTFPNVLIQRCLVHKERNLYGYLPRKHWKEMSTLFSKLRKAQGGEAAKETADAITYFLANKNAQARESFEEAGDELITLFRLGVSNTLHVSLLSTNCIENSFKNLRRHIGRVCRWREETEQADQWLASGLMLAQKGFHKIKGHALTGELITALEKKLRDDMGTQTPKSCAA